LNINERFAKIGIHVPEILIPQNIDMHKWTVVACDQYSSQKEYWTQTANIVGDSPSTLKLILPECYLEEKDKKQRVKDINITMNNYMENGIFKQLAPGFIIVDRSTTKVPSRKGIIIAIDLEHYSFDKNSKSLIRPTEGTLIERLPPRIEIRENAPLDLPHILLLINDETKSIIEHAFKSVDTFETVYDFELMQSGGRIKGHHISDPVYMEKLCLAFEKLAKKNEMLFAVGDGNHSLASAKEIWEKLKRTGAKNNHPSRYVLVEVSNIFNEGIIFEPIHRVLFNIDTDHFFTQLKSKTNAQIIYLNSEEEMKETVYENSTDHKIGFIKKFQWGVISIKKPEIKLTYKVIQDFIDEYLKEKTSTYIDYIHGDRSVYELCEKSGNLGLYLSAIKKTEFFNMIIEDGALPRKTFSIGEADEKRFYLEARKIML